MNITNQFVFVHMPKTGGTFVSQVLRDLSMPSWIQPKLARKVFFRVKNTTTRALGFGSSSIELEKHATCNQIPEKYRGLPIIGCMRNPFDWYVSNYHFQYWLRNPDAYPGLSEDPNWPEIDFDYFIHLSNNVWPHVMNPDMLISSDLGRLTTLFAIFYCKHPDRVLMPDINDEKRFELFKEELYPVTFLDTNTLNQDLFNLLAGFGYDKNKLKFIIHKRRMSPVTMRDEEDHWEKYYSDRLANQIFYKDRLLFKLFPQYLDLSKKALYTDHQNYPVGEN